MSLDETPTSPPGLAFGATFSAAFKAVFGQFGMMLKAAILPFVLSLALGLAAILLTLGAGAMTAQVAAVVVEDGGSASGFGQAAYGVLSFVLQFLGLVPFVLLGIAYCRLALIGRQAGALPRPLLGRRSLVYFGYALLFLLILMLPVIALAIAMMGNNLLALGADPQNLDFSGLASYAGVLVPLFFVFYLFYLYLVTRLSLVFPAVAVDQRLGLAGAWRLTRGASGFKLYALLVVITILCLLVAMLGNALFGAVLAQLWIGPDGLPDMAGGDAWISIAIFSVPVMIFGLIFEYIGFALIIAAIAKAYGTLSGWGGPRAEILERFE
jgi:hypothetical protein